MGRGRLHIREGGDFSMNEALETNKSIRPWHIVVEVIGSILSVLPLIVGRVPLLLLSIIFVPLVFAFPIIIRKHKLLFIPITIMPILIVAVYRYHSPVILVAFAILSVFGVVAGLLIRKFSLGGRTAKILSRTVGLLVLMAPALIVVYINFGAPLHSFPVNRKVRQYVAETYPDTEFDLVVGRTRRAWDGGTYRTRIFDRNNRNIYFEIWYTRERGISDRYTNGGFWNQTYNYMVRPLLDEEFGEFFGFFAIVNGVQVGQPFHKDAPVRTEAHLSVTVKDIEAATLAAEVVRFSDFLEQNNFSFMIYIFRFGRTDGGYGIHIRVPTEYINDNLPELIKYMQSNLNEYGIYHDRQRGIRYTDGSFIHG